MRKVIQKLQISHSEVNLCTVLICFLRLKYQITRAASSQRSTTQSESLRICWFLQIIPISALLCLLQVSILSSYKELTLNTKLFTGHTVGSLLIQQQTLASKVLVCPETSFVLFYQKFDSMRVKRVHKNERKVREKRQELQRTAFSIFFCLFSLLHPQLPSINPAWFLFPYVFEDL